MFFLRFNQTVIPVFFLRFCNLLFYTCIHIKIIRFFYSYVFLILRFKVTLNFLLLLFISYLSTFKILMLNREKKNPSVSPCQSPLHLAQLPFLALYPLRPCWCGHNYTPVLMIFFLSYYIFVIVGFS